MERLRLGTLVHVGEGNRRIVKEAQRVLFACCETQEEIMSGSARRTAASFHRGSRQRHLGLMEPRRQWRRIDAHNIRSVEASKERPVLALCSRRDTRGATAAAFCPPTPLSRSRREPSVHIERQHHPIRRLAPTDDICDRDTYMQECCLIQCLDEPIPRIQGRRVVQRSLKAPV